MEYSQVSDADLLQLCAGNDLRAFNALFDRYVGKLHRMGLRYLKDERVVEELVSDILFSIWQRRHELTIEASLSTYLFRAMHHKAVDCLRRKVVGGVSIHDLPEDALATDHTADTPVLLRDAQDHYQAQLAQLSPQRQKVFRLSREQDMSYAEIATEMNISTNTVKNHINAALQFLRTQLKSIPFLLFLLFCQS
ncbi:RNA polymerase sigma-70 factor [Paraflavitalea pollutisoli]|uniref:RNA polymerase sigma-70 factor n=1 Tax=Paraflavitalea pollutisoli TaxID=3034143 RepID=UPI0023EB543E|nr:RNA polymerase sigma-70 factor [Paraflavitalea sp. H1-2-19X]